MFEIRKKIKSINFIKKKRFKKCRKLWRERQAAVRKRKKAEENAMGNSPPLSEDKQIVEERPSTSRQGELGRKKIRQHRSKA